MKRALFARVLTLAAALAIALTPGCRRNPKGPTPLSGRTGPSEIQNPPPITDLSTSGLEGSTQVPSAPLTDTNIAQGSEPLDRSRYSADRGFFAANVVYFDFDSAVIKNSERGKITAVADYLRSTPRAALEVEGHCDERGTEEYNRSLGERRALAVREELALQGIDPRRIFTISYGEDQPAVEGNNESAWSKNRRGELVLLNAQ
jgi:peptidoglycan-associated lipoprotein